MYFETEAFIHEYVIDGENSGILVGDDAHITYTPENPDVSPSVSIPTDEISSVTFRRDRSLYRNKLLGWFFAVITVLLISVVYVDSFAGQITDPDVDFITFFVTLLILGGISTTFVYFNGEDYDVIVTDIRTDDGESHVFAGRMKNTEFVAMCAELIRSDLETRNQNEKLETELSD